MVGGRGEGKWLDLVISKYKNVTQDLPTLHHLF